MKKQNVDKISKIILHCSANGPNSNIGAAEIRRYHTLPVAQGGRSWEDIGYHYVIRRDGTVEQGRKLEYQGAHCTGHNANSIGVCLVGGVDNSGRPQDNFTLVQFEALALLLRTMRKRWPSVTIHGHNEFANKACPVFDVQAFLDAHGIVKDPNVPPWDAKAWPHFKPIEFTSTGCPLLWGGGEMPAVWHDTLDALERLRAAYGKPLVLVHTEWTPAVPALSCDIKVPADARERFARLAMDAGFHSARNVTMGVRVYFDGEAKQ